MLMNRCTSLAFLLTLTVAEALLRPENVTMEAVNTRYILRWNWDQTQANYTVRFTAGYTYSNEKSYNWVCNRTAENQCDFSFQNLYYWACYTVQVQAEGQRESSQWYPLKFCPDEHASLGPPPHVEVISREAMLTINITEPLTIHNVSMSSIMPLSFWVQYWEKDASQQKSNKKLNTSWGTLTLLKPWTEYCLKVSAFNTDYKKTSPFTNKLCVQTRGRENRLFWKLLPGLLIFLLLVMSPVYYYRNTIQSPCLLPNLPSSIQDPLPAASPLLQLQEESCPVLAVVAVQTPQCQPEFEQRELLQTQRQDSSGQDSGICSGGEGEDSSP
ncbi:interferon alpha/beta receptor 1a-like [Megalops cyprinoides]|uniref:interferon alpha/beta receptor 1a-like n=1 Tax=Megalops cyprinoides TaxID=118141 RepID=UPI0018640A36|nr:interferon alpha/beta receptor 1a-like [Megalops cyprinoides]